MTKRFFNLSSKKRKNPISYRNEGSSSEGSFLAILSGLNLLIDSLILNRILIMFNRYVYALMINYRFDCEITFVNYNHV